MKLKTKALLSVLAVMGGMLVPTFGANANPPHVAKINPLHCVVNTDEVKKVNHLCKLNSGWVNQADASGDYPINCATTYHVLKCLVKHKANVNQKGSRGRTPLHRFIIFAAVSGEKDYKKAVDYLLDNGANIDIRDDKNLTPLDLLKRMYDNSTDEAMRLRIKLYLDLLSKPGGRLCR